MDGDCIRLIAASVDHDTVLDLAGSGKANPGSLYAAIELAIDLAKINCGPPIDAQ